MDCKDLKKLLAGLGVAALVSTGGVSLPGAHAAGGSGWSSDKDSAGSAEKIVEKTAGSGGWSGTKDSAVSAVKDEAEEAADSVGDEAKEKVDDATKKVKEETGKAVEKAAGGSGWGGSK